ncbi:MAG TPA: phage tail sheath subtilisin-like domain-containing protein [Casimicrobiaceae bacterium]|nr:phage tail sheath subtilisin-like domain-containing protein [Casimicrobiaceae bacterium]
MRPVTRAESQYLKTMPEYLAPGVYIEEIPSGVKPIEGVDTSTAGFIGMARSGPLDTPVGPMTSLVEFERQFGDGSAIVCAGAPPIPAFMWHAVHAFFDGGGKHLWAVRVCGNAKSDGCERPGVEEFERGIALLDAVKGLAMIAAPGATFVAPEDPQDDAAEIMNTLIAHAELMRYRLAVLDSPNGQTIEQVGAWRARFSSSRAALYWPWVKARDANGAQILLPPSAFIAGVFASIDIERGVNVSPADQPVRGASGVEAGIDDAQAAALDAQGIGCIRELAGRGIRVWNAPTLTGDPEWKYVNVRRYLIYLERSIEDGVQWAVFETNGEELWQNVQQTVSDFLFNEWQHGSLKGSAAHDALFVRCDRSTMTRNDIDNGRVVVLVGVAPAKPAEFVMLRITVQTAPKC